MKKYFHPNRIRAFFTVSIVLCVVASSIVFSTSCLGRTHDATRKSTNNLSKARSILINYPINLTGNTLLAQTVYQDLKAHFSVINKQSGTVAVYAEEDIKKAHLFMQVVVQDQLWDQKRKVLIWQLEVTLKENGTERYYLRSSQLRIKAEAPIDGNSYDRLQQTARKKLKAALDYFFVYRSLPVF